MATTKDEAYAGKETPEEEAKEEASEEAEETTGTEGVKVPEEFQKQVYSLVSGASTKEMLSYIRDCVFQKEDEIRQAELKKTTKGKKVPSEYSSAEMPAD